MNHLATTALWLGRAGLLPFCAGPLLIMLDGPHSALYTRALGAYAMAIVCFLAGSWWGIALLRRAPAVLLASNVIVIAAVAGGLLLSPPVALLWLAALLVVLLRIERSHSLFAPQPAYYARLRLQLTVVAVASLCAASLLA